MTVTFFFLFHQPAGDDEVPTRCFQDVSIGFGVGHVHCWPDVHVVTFTVTYFILKLGVEEAWG